MNWEKYVADRTVSAAEAVGHIQSGQRVIVGHACASPEILLDALTERAGELQNVSLVHMVAMGRGTYCQPEYNKSFRHVALFAGTASRAAIAEGRAEYIPCFFSEIPALFRTGALHPDIAVVMVSPPDDHGYVSLGISVDYTREAVLQASVVIAEVNAAMPRTMGNSFIHVSRVNWFVESNAPLIELGAPSIGEIEKRIGKHVASLVQDGDCLQLGIGAIPDAVLAFLHEKKELGIHSEMISDGVMALMQNGVITNTRKRLLPGRSVISFAMGSKSFYRWLHNNPAVEVHPVDWVNDPRVIAENDNVMSINSAISVDLLGQAASDMLGNKQFSGVGGQVDFIRGAAFSKGGRSVLALPATASGGTVSRICCVLHPGQAVTTSRNDIDSVVTEYGIARLAGKTLRERAAALVGIAAPKFREALCREARDCYGWTLVPDESSSV